MRNPFLLLLLLALAGGTLQAATLGTAISYQGRLDDSGNPASGTYSFRYRLLGDAAGTTQIGPVVDVPSQTIAAGLLNTSLDFGPNAFNTEARWLEVSVKTGGPGSASEYIKLNPQPLPPGGSSQFARMAGDVLNGTITGAKLAPLAITTTHISDGAITAPKLGPASVSSGNVADNAITAAKIASGQVVKSLTVGGNALRDNVTLVAGSGISLTPNGNNLTLASSGTGTSPWGEIGNTISYNGNVGIGTSNPQRRLQVGDANVPGSEGMIRLASRSGVDGNLRIWEIGVPQTGADAAFGYHFVIDDTHRDGTNPEFIIRWDTGNVGIGSINPVSKLEVIGAASQTAVLGYSSGSIGVFGRSTSFTGVHGETASAGAAAVVGINLNTSGGQGVFGESLGSGVGVYGKSANFEGVHGESSSPNTAAVAGINKSTGFGIYGRSLGGGYAGVFDGKVRVCVLEITGGCDLAEPFAMEEGTIEKGAVVVIDKAHPGQLKRSTQAYDRRVAGIVSGANGINPGIALKQEGALDQGQNVALTGRVYVQADASFGAIEPGDLLTTSDTPGHAMKVTDNGKAQGAILGKAMGALADGKGLVLVLVTLQ